ncbi:uncharacterized protein LOC129808453 [Phlebotomus papatasi]|uniref:uncharacterized protein LOC129808453 n=1 Tax=Phlebotomus papatasi TaxID=29031 RepID=UPI002483FA19|nr:uncharacterized protein LOC129808453 [Phlebotomus papatasi]
MLDAMNSICLQITRFTNTSYCISITSQMNFMYKNLLSQNQLLKHLKFHRSKRGLFDGIGTAFKWLIGTLDENDAQDFNSKISFLQNNTQKVIEKFNAQTIIMKNALSTLYSHDKEIALHLNNIKNQTLNLKNDVNTLKNLLKQELVKEQQVKIQMHFNELSTSVVITTFLMKDQIDHIADILLSTSDNRIHPSILNPNDLVEELRNAHLPLSDASTTIYALENDNAFKLLKLITMHAYILDSFVLFKFDLPLVSRDNFALHKISSIPEVLNSTSYLEMIVDHKFIGVNEFKYILLTMHELQTCTILDNSMYLCEYEHPIYKSPSNPSCEYQLYLDGNAMLCKRAVMKLNHEIWIPLFKKNVWVYVLPNITNVFLNCNKSKEKITLKNTGILRVNKTIEGNCKIITDQIVIQIFKEYPIDFNFTMFHTDNVDMTKDTPKLFHNQSETLNFTEYDIKVLKDLNFNKDIEKEVNSLNKIDYIDFHDIHHYTVIYCVLVIGIIIVSFMYYKKKQKEKVSKCALQNVSIATPQNIQNHSAQNMLNEPIYGSV